MEIAASSKSANFELLAVIGCRYIGPMIPVVPQKGSYSDVTLCFLDLLGYKRALQTTAAEVPNVLLTLAGLAYFFSKTTLSGMPIKVERRVISDSIILWTDDSDEGLGVILEICRGFQDACLQFGFLSRGAIVRGKHYAEKVPYYDQGHDRYLPSSEEVIISPALVAAYEAERRLELPLIHIASDLEGSLTRINQVGGSPFNMGYRLISNSGGVLLDGYLSCGNLQAVKSEYTGRDFAGVAREAVKILEHTRKGIVAGLSNDCEKVRRKWQYVKDRYNELIDSATPASGVSASLKI